MGEYLTFLNILYALIALWLAIYGFNSFVLVGLYLKHRRKTELCPSLDTYPLVTVQLPLYNEKYVVQRAIEHLVRLDWPRERLQIQVVDDSTDETTVLARQQVEQWQRQGVDVTLVHRKARSGFKAGALNAALETARGEFVAIFDADFCPEPDFLQRTVPYLAADPDLGFVQTRWSHLNGDLSPLTRAQAIALDGHHMVEHTARSRAGLLANFSGTGGVWRTVCIQDSSGWDAQMLTEDVDLGYRAQLRGWKGLMLPEVVSPGELPTQLLAFKQQQFRWAKGNVQCLLKLALPLARAPISLGARLQSLIHLSYYLAHPLMLLVMFFALPSIWLGERGGATLVFRSLGTPVALLLSLATLGPPLLYVLGQREIYGDWTRRLRALPVVVCLGTGLALNSTAAIIEALLGIKTAFRRTPKLSGWVESESSLERSYCLSPGRLIWGEFLLALYALLAIAAAVIRQNWLMLPFLLLYLAGFSYVAGLGVWEVRPRFKNGRRARGQRLGRPRQVKSTGQL